MRRMWARGGAADQGVRCETCAAVRRSTKPLRLERLVDARRCCVPFRASLPALPRSPSAPCRPSPAPCAGRTARRGPAAPRPTSDGRRSAGCTRAATSRPIPTGASARCPTACAMRCARTACRRARSSIRVRIDAGSLMENGQRARLCASASSICRFRGSEHVPDGEAKRDLAAAGRDLRLGHQRQHQLHPDRLQARPAHRRPRPSSTRA